jgi:ribosomal protein L12E/L44/L45/RPP1/RPP2
MSEKIPQVPQNVLEAKEALFANRITDVAAFLKQNPEKIKDLTDEACIEAESRRAPTMAADLLGLVLEQVITGRNSLEE